jgi:glutathione S-transferase
MAKLERKYPRVVTLHDAVAARRSLPPLISPRRLPFSQEGIFRHYPNSMARRC